MGNIMSGRPQSLRNHQFTSYYYKLDIRQLRQLNLLEPGLELPWHTLVKETASLPIHIHKGGMTVHHRLGTDEDLSPYVIQFDQTECHFGGVRHWFICPEMFCQARVAVLYYNGLFKCRHCRNLRYRTQSMSAKQRAFHSAKKIRIKLGWRNSVDIKRPKPKNMHCASYIKLIWQHEAYMAKGMGLGK